MVTCQAHSLVAFLLNKVVIGWIWVIFRCIQIVMGWVYEVLV